MTTQIRQQNGISILEPQWKDRRALRIRITESHLATDRGVRSTAYSYQFQECQYDR